jgi:hypothetical protein
MSATRKNKRGWGLENTKVIHKAPCAVTLHNDTILINGLRDSIEVKAEISHSKGVVHCLLEGHLAFTWAWTSILCDDNGQMVAIPDPVEKLSKSVWCHTKPSHPRNGPKHFSFAIGGEFLYIAGAVIFGRWAGKSTGKLSGIVIHSVVGIDWSRLAKKAHIFIGELWQPRAKSGTHFGRVVLAQENGICEPPNVKFHSALSGGFVLVAVCIPWLVKMAI